VPVLVPVLEPNLVLIFQLSDVANRLQGMVMSFVVAESLLRFTRQHHPPGLAKKGVLVDISTAASRTGNMVVIQSLKYF